MILQRFATYCYTGEKNDNYIILFTKWAKPKMNYEEKFTNDFLIRKADWRFLLSNPKPTKSIFFGEKRLKEMLTIVSEHVVDISTDPRDIHFELAVAYEPDVKIMQKIFSVLKPGGECYIEWRSSPFASIKSLESKLSYCGFDNILSYIPIPNQTHQHAKIWIPINTPEAVTYSLKLYFKNGNKKTNFIRKIRYTLLSLSRTLIITFPWLLSTRLNNLLITTIARKPTLNTKNNYKEPRKLMVTEGDDLDNKPVLFLFVNNEKYPSYVTKITRVQQYAYELENEAKTLQSIEEKYPCLNGIPKVLFTDYSSGFFSVGETFIQGTQVSKIVTKENFRNLALKTTSWLIKLGMETKILNQYGTKLSDSMLLELITHLNIRDDMAQKTRTITKGLRLRYLVCEHRDFAPQNVLIDPKGNLGVIDWEVGRLIGMPALDLIFFLILLNFYLENAWETGKYREAYRNILDPTTFAGRIFDECFDLYASKLDIDIKEKGTLRTLAILTWLYTHIPVLIKNQSSLTKNMFYVLWQEELVLLTKNTNPHL